MNEDEMKKVIDSLTVEERTVLLALNIQSLGTEIAELLSKVHCDLERLEEIRVLLRTKGVTKGGA